MKKTTLFFTGIALCLGMAACSFNSKKIQCTLKGEVIDRPYSDTLILLKFTERSYFMTETAVRIPIHDGRFEYVLNCSHEEKYKLIFLDEYQNASWHPVYFFSEKGEVNFTLYPREDAEKNRIEGPALNTEYYTLEKKTMEILSPRFEALDAEVERLMREGKYNSAEVEKIYEKIDAATDDERFDLYEELNKLREEKKDLTPEARAVTEEYERALRQYLDMKWQHAKEYPTIVGYSIVVEAAWFAAHPSSTWFSTDITPAVELYNAVYAAKYPKHPYTEQMKIFINSAESIKVGGRYIDFEAPDLQGNNVKLSEQIQGKMALIFLWASWCGPCRRYGEKLIPVYESYKDKGFTVLGVARESKIDSWKAALENEKYPWLNLIELNDKAQIWTKYGVSGAGGEFLIDENGVILAISPTVEELEKILQEKLK